MKSLFFALLWCMVIVLYFPLQAQEKLAAKLEKSHADGKYSSPYAVKFSFSREKLIGDLLS